jgi:hypothetical protein
MWLTAQKPVNTGVDRAVRLGPRIARVDVAPAVRAASRRSRARSRGVSRVVDRQLALPGAMATTSTVPAASSTIWPEIRRP